MFQEFVDSKGFSRARQWIEMGFVAGVCEDTGSGDWYIEVDTVSSPPEVVKATVTPKGLLVAYREAKRSSGRQASTAVAVTVELLKRVGAIAVPGNTYEVGRENTAPEVPTLGLTDRTPGLLGRGHKCSILKPEFADEVTPEEVVASALDESADPSEVSFDDFGEFEFDPLADETRAVLVEEGVPKELIDRVLAFQRKRGLSLEDLDKLPEFKPFRGNRSVLILGLVAMLTGKNLYFVGPASTGKTVLARALSRMFGLECHEINGSLRTELADIRGEKTLTVDESTGQNVVGFDAGPLVTAMEGGHVCYVDEQNAILEGVAMVLNAAGDWRRTIEVPGYGTVKAHPDFRLMMAGNRGYSGTVSPNQSLLDRTVVVDLDPIQDVDAIAKIIGESAKLSTDKALISKLARLFVNLQAMVTAGEIRASDCLTIRGLVDAADLVAQSHGALSPKFVLRKTVSNKIWDDTYGDDVARIQEQIDLMFPK